MACTIGPGSSVLGGCHDFRRADGDPRIDLAEATFTIEDAAASAAEVQAVIVPSGAEQGGDFTGPVMVVDRVLGAGLANPKRPDAKGSRLGAKARTVVHADHLSLVWRLRPHRASVLTFRPAQPTDPRCRAEHRWTIRDGDRSVEVFRFTAVGGPLWESAEQSVELSAWAGREIELVASGTLAPATGPAVDCSTEALGWISPLATDPFQEHNLAGQGHPTEGELAARLEAWLADDPRGIAAVEVVATGAERAMLRQLGYAD